MTVVVVIHWPFNEWNSGAGVENPVLQFRAYSDGHFRKHGRNL